MDEVPPPRLEGAVRLPDGRRLGLAEYGAASGDAVLWFHGTPGARRQVPPGARTAAAARGIRLVAIERPGVGASTPHLYEDVRGFAHDVAVVADRLGIDRFALVGLSGGGPYVLACAHELGSRVRAGAVLGGVAPAVGPEAAPGGLVGLSSRFGGVLRVGHQPLGRVLRDSFRFFAPVASPAFDLYVRVSPEGDRVVFRAPGMKAMFLDDLVRNSRRRFVAPVLDLVLFARPWGFSLRDVRTPIRWWHGDADHIVPLAHGRHVTDLLPDAELHVRPRESHLGGLGIAREVLDAVLGAGPGDRATMLAP